MTNQKKDKKNDNTKFWYCNNCNYVISNIEYLTARFDYPCPRCNQSTIHQFISKRNLYNEHTTS